MSIGKKAAAEKIESRRGLKNFQTGKSSLFDSFDKKSYNKNMKNTLLDIKIAYSKLGASEKRIADYILSHPEKMVSLSISELADLSGSSEPTITRFSRRLGFSGFQQLKISMAGAESGRNVTEEISVSDEPSVVFDKVANDIYCSLEKTKKLIDNDDFKKACDKIIRAERIIVFGLGNSSSVATDAAHKLLRLGYDANAYTDNHMQVIAAAHLNENCVVLAVTHSGSSKDVVDALKTAKSCGAATIVITDENKSPVYKYSDFVLATSSDEINYRILGLTSRITQLAIVDTMYYYVTCHTENSGEKIQQTLNALSSKKY